MFGAVEDVECAACGATAKYSVADDGSIPDPCRECGEDALEVIHAES